MIASEPCYNGIIYNRNFANENFWQIKFRDFAKKLNLAKFFRYTVLD